MSALPTYATWNTSGTWRWNPALSDHLIEAYSRLQIRGPALTQEHVIEGRRSMNYILQDWSSRGVNLWQVGDPDMLPLNAGQAEYSVPVNTVDLLDTYLRTYTPSQITTTLGSTLTPQVTQAGIPIVTQPWGDPTIIEPGSGTLSSIAGSQTITFNWPAHGLSAGAPIFWSCPVSVGGLAISGFSIADTIVDQNNVTFLAPQPAFETQNGQGGTPLLTTSNGSSVIDVILPGHGLAVGENFDVGISTVVGGLTISGTYPVIEVLNTYEFSIDASRTDITQYLLSDTGQILTDDHGNPLIAGNVSPGPFATGNDSKFVNAGQLTVATQAEGASFVDIFLWPISRNDYAYLPDKFVQGRPTTFWFNRQIAPTVTVWPVPPPGSFYGFVTYRMREIQDANPLMGENLEAPRRFFPVFAAKLTAALAEKYKPEAFVEKMQRAEILWERASEEDREKVEFNISPDLSGF